MAILIHIILHMSRYRHISSTVFVTVVCLAQHVRKLPCDWPIYRSSLSWLCWPILRSFMSAMIGSFWVTPLFIQHHTRVEWQACLGMFSCYIQHIICSWQPPLQASSLIWMAIELLTILWQGCALISPLSCYVAYDFRLTYNLKSFNHSLCSWGMSLADNAIFIPLRALGFAM